MAQLQLKSQRFRSEREADWRRLESLLIRLERGGTAKLAIDQLVAIPVLYQQALSSLSIARAISLDRSLVSYLENLCARAYFVVYGARARPLERLAQFFAHDWPDAVRSLWRETLVCAAITLAGAVAAFLLVIQDPDWFYGFVPSGLAAGRDPAASTEFLRGTLHSAVDARQGLGALAAFLFTHNTQLAFFAFALGFALCLPTAAFMVFNGCVLGAFMALFASRGLALPAAGWLLIHGVTELFAVILAGAAGLSLGWSVAFPGEQTRVEAAGRVGRRGGLVMGGVVVMLFLAGLLEGFARQLVQPDLARYLIAALSAALWGAYFYWPRGRTA